MKLTNQAQELIQEMNDINVRLKEIEAEKIGKDTIDEYMDLGRRIRGIRRELIDSMGWKEYNDYLQEEMKKKLKAVESK